LTVTLECTILAGQNASKSLYVAGTAGERLASGDHRIGDPRSNNEKATKGDRTMSPVNIDKQIKVRGATVENTYVVLPATGETIVQFSDPPVWENGNFFTAGAPTRLKVPPDLAGRHIVHAVVHWYLKNDGTFTTAFRDGSYFLSRLMKNGDASHNPREARSTAAPVATASMTSQSILWETNLVAGDYCELKVCWYVSDPSLKVPDNDLRLETWLTLRRLGKPA
jgi:hypothetical protein